MASRRTTTKDVGLLFQLFQDGQLTLAPEYQRNSVWPRAAKTYLIDSVLKNRPIPPLLMQRQSASIGSRNSYEVVDGQQRLRAVFDFVENRYRLGLEVGAERSRRRYRDLDPGDQRRILDYDFVVEELSGYEQDEIQDIFIRVNRYVVSLNHQEIRKAKESGAFADFVQRVGEMDFWRTHRVLTDGQILRMRNYEFAAELVILLAEGPQDKKASIDTWYAQYRDEFPEAEEIYGRLSAYISAITAALPNFQQSRYRKPVDLYSLIGAFDQVAQDADGSVIWEVDRIGSALTAFESECEESEPGRDAVLYITAASRQTDNVRPRQTRIAILSKLIV